MPKKQWTHGVDSHNLVLCHRAFAINKSQRLGVTQCTSPGTVALSPGDSGPPVGRVWAGNPANTAAWQAGSQSQTIPPVTGDAGRREGGSLFPQWGSEEEIVHCKRKMWPRRTKGGPCQVTNQHLGAVSAMPWAPQGFGPALYHPVLCPWMSVCRGCVQTWGTSDRFPWNKLPANFLTFNCWGAGEGKTQTFLLRSCPNYRLFIIWEIILYT